MKNVDEVLVNAYDIKKSLLLRLQEGISRITLLCLHGTGLRLQYSSHVWNDYAYSVIRIMEFVMVLLAFVTRLDCCSKHSPSRSDAFTICDYNFEAFVIVPVR